VDAALGCMEASTQIIFVEMLSILFDFNSRKIMESS
jgi:hypothetical protein